MSANENPKAPTKTLVWRQAHPLHSRIMGAENGLSREYHFHPDNHHTLEVDEADAAVIMAGPDRAEFRIKAGKSGDGE